MSTKLNLNMGNIFTASKLEKFKKQIIKGDDTLIVKTIQEIHDGILDDPFTIKIIPENLWLSAFIVGALQGSKKETTYTKNASSVLATLTVKMYRHYEDESKFNEIANDAIANGKAFGQRCFNIEENLKNKSKE